MERIGKTTLRSPLTFKLDKEDIEKSTGVSMTVPDESMSIETILKKFTTGLDPGVYREGSYDSSATFDSPDLEKLREADLYDKEVYRKGLAVKMLEDEKTLKDNEQKERARREAEAQEYNEVRDELRNRKKNTTGGDSKKGGAKVNDDAA